jgi:membrane associated rhomboid family serine protease
MKEVKEMTATKKTWLGFGLIVIGSSLLGYMLTKLDFLLGLLGAAGHCMAILGLYILSGVGKE